MQQKCIGGNFNSEFYSSLGNRRLDSDLGDRRAGPGSCLAGDMGPEVAVLEPATTSHRARNDFCQWHSRFVGLEPTNFLKIMPLVSRFWQCLQSRECDRIGLFRHAT